MDRITVVMSIYKPKKEWLKSQLISINNQTYKNIILLVWNDCPKDNFDYEKFLKKYIVNISFKYYIGEKNYGSNKAFELLTKKTNTEYIAYCDQDDIWKLNKLEILIRDLKKENGDLIYSNMDVIDSKGKIISNRIEYIRPRQKAYNGNNITKELLKRNFITGCTILMKTNIAKRAIPFPKYIVHDHWLGIYCSIYGKILYCDKSLIQYRIHSQQQTGVLSGVFCKNDYYENKILNYFYRISKIKARLNKNEYIEKAILWSRYRVLYYKNKKIKDIYNMLIYNMDIKITIFEILLPVIPSKIWRFFIELIKKGKI